MYGIVNKAIQGLVLEKFGTEAWDRIRKRSGVEHESFMNNTSYPDSVTFSLASAASEELAIPLNDILIAFGEYWILKTGMETYGHLMKAGGKDLRSFLYNLPNFHSRVMLLYPNLTPPEFKIEEVDDRSLRVHYFSTRQGLTYFMIGLLQGLGKMFDTRITILIETLKGEGSDHDIFKVIWA